MKLPFRHRIPLLLIHISFVFIAAGGLCTALLSRHGSLHLYPGETSGSFILEDSRVSSLPTPLTLQSFDIDYYPDSALPKDYRSTLTTANGDTLRISMNHIGRLAGGYRLYQTSYDEYGGTWLTVSHDPVGTSLVYLGFLLFIIGTVGDFAYRLRRPSLRRCALYALAVALICLVACFVFLNPNKDGRLPVLATWWLPVHVGFCASGYVTLASTLPLAIVAAMRRKKRERLLSLALRITAPGVCLLGIGIILGALWANVSWGRYWGWDPKETWALVSFLIYSITLHLHISTCPNPDSIQFDLDCGPNAVRTPNLSFREGMGWGLLILGFLSIAMTYWGVNYLPSLHSYF